MGHEHVLPPHTRCRALFPPPCMSRSIRVEEATGQPRPPSERHLVVGAQKVELDLAAASSAASSASSLASKGAKGQAAEAKGGGRAVLVLCAGSPLQPGLGGGKGPWKDPLAMKLLALAGERALVASRHAKRALWAGPLGVGRAGCALVFGLSGSRLAEALGCPASKLEAAGSCVAVRLPAVHGASSSASKKTHAAALVTTEVGGLCCSAARLSHR